jgi:2-(1,2-epoxy-1,2-dihydrophenyl)acetyl-CoA isomerase
MTHIAVDVAHGIGTLTIDRRASFNSLDVETARDLRKAGLQLSRDAGVRVVVLRGSGGVFCSGADLKYIRAGAPNGDLGYLLPANAVGERSGYGASFKQILEYLHSTISEIRRAAKPWIAAVDGIAAAGGFGLAMSCDLVLASERSTFEWAYAKTGLTGAESSTFFLPKLIGLRRAMQFALMNPRLTAAEALRWGLVTAVHRDDDFERAVDETARTLAAAPTEALGIAKRLINEAAGVDRLDRHLDRELEQLAAITDGADFAEGMAAFFEKRPPAFAGR